MSIVIIITLRTVEKPPLEAVRSSAEKIRPHSYALFHMTDMLLHCIYRFNYFYSINLVLMGKNK